MLICREAFQPEGSYEWCLIGVHRRVRAPRFPWQHPFAVFVSIGDFTGGSQLALVVGSGSEELARAEGRPQVAPELGSLDDAITFPRVPFPEAGAYRIELRIGGELMAARTLVLERDAP